MADTYSFTGLGYQAGSSRIFGRRYDIEQMARAIESYDLPGAERAAADTRRVVALLDEANRAAMRLAEVWNDVETHLTSESGAGWDALDDVTEALASYVNPTPAAAPSDPGSSA